MCGEHKHLLAPLLHCIAVTGAGAAVYSVATTVYSKLLYIMVCNSHVFIQNTECVTEVPVTVSCNL